MSTSTGSNSDGRRVVRQTLQDRHPVEHRHSQVEQDQVGFELGDRAEEGLAVGERGDRGVAGAAKDGLEQRNVRRFVVGDVDPAVQHRGHLGRWPSSAAGE